MIFRTISGSTYEVDQQNKKIRRLYGKLPSTERQGLDGEWKTYCNLSDVVIGKPTVIVWKWETDSSGNPLVDVVAKSTMTSLITEIVEENKLS